MRFLKKYFSMYAHLPKEIYVLAFGKIMTSMGALIWPMLTLIMSEKLKPEWTDHRYVYDDVFYVYGTILLIGR